ncbi:MAG: MEKHLA domain-containing protein [Verrucomicrobiota bacterium]
MLSLTRPEIMSQPQPWATPFVLTQTQRLLQSYRHWINAPLLENGVSTEETAAALYGAPFVVVSHGTEEDPILNYGNRAALDLWETDAATFSTMPSRLTAEPMEREERARMLERTARDGFIDDYSGVRITSTGRRFFIPRATVWNLIDEGGRPCGQAATFSKWEFL